MGRGRPLATRAAGALFALAAARLRRARGAHPRASGGHGAPLSSAGQARACSSSLWANGRKASVLGADRLDAAEWSPGADGHSFRSLRTNSARSRTQDGIAAGDDVLEFGPLGSTYGPPVFVAVQVVPEALERACRDGRPSRLEAQRHIRAVRFGTILRYAGRFGGGDVPQARLLVYRVRDGDAVTVR